MFWQGDPFPPIWQYWPHTVGGEKRLKQESTGAKPEQSITAAKAVADTSMRKAARRVFLGKAMQTAFLLFARIRLLWFISVSFISSV